MSILGSAKNTITSGTDKMKNFLVPGEKLSVPDDEGLSDILKAQHEWDLNAEKYRNYYAFYYGDKSKKVYELSKVANDYGILNQNIPFYKTHLGTTFVTTIFNNKTSKILSGATQNDKEFNADYFTNQFIYNYLALGNFYVFNYVDEEKKIHKKIIDYYRIDNRDYGHDLITVKSPNEYEVIEYHKDESRAYIYAVDLLEKNENKQKVFLSEHPFSIYPIYEITRPVNDISNIKDSLLAISTFESLMVAEGEELRATLHADELYFSNGKFVKKGNYRIYSGRDSNDQPLFKYVNEQLKSSQYSEVLEYEKKNISNELGLSLTFLGLDKSSDTTATEIRLNDAESIQRINKDKQEIQFVYNQIMTAFDPTFKEVKFTLLTANELNSRVELANKVYQLVSVQKRVEILFPELTEEEQRKEVMRIKIEQGIPLTSDDEQYLSTILPIVEEESTFE